MRIYFNDDVTCTRIDHKVAGTTAIHHAAAKQNPDMARAILQCRPAFIKRREAVGRTPLVVLCGTNSPITSDTLSTATVLIRYGVDVNSKDKVR